MGPLPELDMLDGKKKKSKKAKLPRQFSKLKKKSAFLPAETSIFFLGDHGRAALQWVARCQGPVLSP